MNDWAVPEERGCKGNDDDDDAIETIIASRYFQRTRRIRRRVGRTEAPRMISTTTTADTADSSDSSVVNRKITFTTSANKKRRTLGRNRNIHSQYFCRSPTSAFGVAQPLTVDSLLFPGNAGHNSDECGSSLVVLRHFGSCTVFRERWDNFSERDDNETQKLEYAVRHLCGCNCFMRAYAPCRDLWSLHVQQAILTASLMGQDFVYNCDPTPFLLQGWKCRLLPPEEAESIFGLEAPFASASASSAKNHTRTIQQRRRTYLPRTVFVDPYGNCFPSIPKVLQHLSAAATDRLKREPLAVVTPTKRRMKPCRVAACVSVTNRDNSNSNTSTPMTDTNTPFGLLEELFVHDPWRLLLSTIFLNRTSRVQVDSVLHDFLQEWPTAQSVVAYGDGHQQDNYHQMSQLLQPLGMRHRRARGIVRFSQDYCHRQQSATSSRPLTRADIPKLYACGEYAAAAYEIFIQRQYLHHGPDPTDHALQMYLEYQRGRYGCKSHFL